ncbi:tRNA-dihydrouridine(47) synthase [NAD(P)(+)] [Frankliniella fusca]|uniref:tRNA-dihydrouridine(47) synthase [NAD(P)(+)] n=1 Tax=Frankliniella fusca TaxID=407009 RepID=A0AAE1LN25_9NEOP|nr:tRNA-dihydrouridine(47) synthase [NAD(P)(+)] [Frankliniella fusca]
MALLALQKSDERYAALLENFNDLKKELREIKETDLENTIPDGMVHIGGGKCISLVHVAKLEKLDDLRGRLACLCRLYWPGKELSEWSLSGKKGKNTVNKITNDYSAGMAEILSCMHRRKKANLEHSNVHRTLSRVISELHNKKGKKKSYWQKSPVKEKMRDMEGQSDEDVDKDNEDNSNEQLNDKKSSTGSEKMRDMEEESGGDEDTDEEENSKELLNNKKRSSGSESEASDSDSK